MMYPDELADILMYVSAAILIFIIAGLFWNFG